MRNTNINTKEERLLWFSLEAPPIPHSEDGPEESLNSEKDDPKAFRLKKEHDKEKHAEGDRIEQGERHEELAGLEQQFGDWAEEGMAEREAEFQRQDREQIKAAHAEWTEEERAEYEEELRANIDDGQNGVWAEEGLAEKEAEFQRQDRERMEAGKWTDEEVAAYEKELRANNAKRDEMDELLAAARRGDQRASDLIDAQFNEELRAAERTEPAWQRALNWLSDLLHGKR